MFFCLLCINMGVNFWKVLEAYNSIKEIYIFAVIL